MKMEIFGMKTKSDGLILKLFFLSFVSCILFLSCSMNFGESSSQQNPEEQNKSVYESEWVILVYMAADNNLESAAITDFNELEAVDIPDNVKILVLFDRAEGFDTSNDDWYGTRLYEVKNDENGRNIEIVSRQIDCDKLGLKCGQGSELDMGNKETLAGFLKFAVDEYESSNYALIIWGHGDGWRGDDKFSGNLYESKAEADGRAFSIDDGNDSFLTLNEMRLGIEQAMEGRKLNFLGFDTCFGATMEVAYEFKDCAKILAGTSGITANGGWNYESLFSDFFSSDLTELRMAECAMEQYYQQYKKTNYASFITVNLEKFQNVYAAFNDWCDAVNRVITDKMTQLAVREFMCDSDQIYAYYSPAASGSYEYFIDVFDLCSKLDLLLCTENIFEQTLVLQEALLAAVIESWAKDESKSFISMGVLLNRFSSDKTPCSSHPESYYYMSRELGQNLFTKDSSSWAPTYGRNISLLDKIFYWDFD